MVTHWKNDYRQINVDELHLDLKNPRTDTGEKMIYKDLIQELWDENTLELLESISNKGYAASAILMVIKEDKKNVVIDGNRRLLAVQLLHNPSDFEKYVPDIIPYKDFEKVKTLSQNKKEDIFSLTAIFYPTRLKAEQEMSILHLDGEAVKKWGPLRQFRYFQNQLRKNKISVLKLAEMIGVRVDRIKRGLITIQLYEFAKSKINFEDSLSVDIFGNRNFRTDKFQKTVVNEEGERFLGYSFSDKEGEIIISNKKKFTERLKLVLIELYDANSRFFKSAQYPTENRSRFFKKIDPKFLNSIEYRDNKKNEESQLSTEKNDIDTTDDTKKVSSRPLYSEDIYKGRQTQSKGSVVKDIKGLPDVSSEKIREMFKELKYIDTSKSPMMTAVNIRILLDITTKELLKKSGKNFSGTLKDRMLRVAKEVGEKDEGRENLVKALHKDFYTKKLNEIVHNTIFQMSEGEVRKAWSNVQQFFEFMIKEIKNIEDKTI